MRKSEFKLPSFPHFQRISLLSVMLGFYVFMKLDTCVANYNIQSVFTVITSLDFHKSPVQ